MSGRLRLLLALAGCLVLFSSCLMVVEGNPRKAEEQFQKTRQKIYQLSSSQKASGRPARFKALIYDSEERQLIRVSLPLWLVKKGLREDLELDFRKGKSSDFETRVLAQALFELPRGLLMEVWSENEKILLWLE